MKQIVKVCNSSHSVREHIEGDRKKIGAMATVDLRKNRLTVADICYHYVHNFFGMKGRWYDKMVIVDQDAGRNVISFAKERLK